MRRSWCRTAEAHLVDLQEAVHLAAFVLLLHHLLREAFSPALLDGLGTFKSPASPPVRFPHVVTGVAAPAHTVHAGQEGLQQRRDVSERVGVFTSGRRSRRRSSSHICLGPAWRGRRSPRRQPDRVLKGTETPLLGLNVTIWVHHQSAAGSDSVQRGGGRPSIINQVIDPRSLLHVNGPQQVQSVLIKCLWKLNLDPSVSSNSSTPSKRSKVKAHRVFRLRW